VYGFFFASPISVLLSFIPFFNVFFLGVIALTPFLRISGALPLICALLKSPIAFVHASNVASAHFFTHFQATHTALPIGIISAILKAAHILSAILALSGLSAFHASYASILSHSFCSHCFHNGDCATCFAKSTAHSFTASGAISLIQVAAT